MKEHKHLGAYGIIIKDSKILLIKKNGGPYHGKLDLPGGTIEFMERPEDTLVREIKEEVGIDITDFELLDVDSTNVSWVHKGKEENIHHIAIFYMIIQYKNNVERNIEITQENDDSMGAEFYDISSLRKSQLSNIAILEIEKLGYILLNK